MSSNPQKELAMNHRRAINRKAVKDAKQRKADAKEAKDTTDESSKEEKAKLELSKTKSN